MTVKGKMMAELLGSKVFLGGSPTFPSGTLDEGLVISYMSSGENFSNEYLVPYHSSYLVH